MRIGRYEFTEQEIRALAEVKLIRDVVSLCEHLSKTQGVELTLAQASKLYGAILKADAEKSDRRANCLAKR